MAGKCNDTWDLPPMEPTPRWMSDRTLPCKGMDTRLFFPTTPKVPVAARTACAACPRADDCLEWALVHEMVGYWGGHSATSRVRIRRERAAEAAEAVAS